MIKNIYKIGLSRVVKGSCLLLFVFILSGCKEWLSKKPTTGIATPETLADMQALLDEKNTFHTRRTPSFPEASADDYFMLESTYKSLGKNYTAPYLWEIYPYDISNDWRTSYAPIYTANLCLEQVNKIQRTNANATQWDNIKGSSLFYRAYYFLQLSWTYSKAYNSQTSSTDPGIVLKLGSDIDEHSVRASVEQSYAQIINDATESLLYLPETSHPLRPSKAAAYGLLARTFLSMRQYDNALKYSELCLSINSQLMNYNGDKDIITTAPGYNLPFKQYNKETIFYTEMSTNHPTVSWVYGLIDSTLFDSYDPHDLRKTIFFRDLGSYKVFKGNYSQTDNYFSGIAVDEILLIRAECKARVGGANHTGDKEAALSDLNELLKVRWDATFTKIMAINAEDALKIILKERRKELVMRGLRWSDIKRLNLENFNIIPIRKLNGQTYLLPPNDRRYALPIPQEIIDLTGIIQNPQ